MLKKIRSKLSIVGAGYAALLIILILILVGQTKHVKELEVEVVEAIDYSTSIDTAYFEALDDIAKFEITIKGYEDELVAINGRLIQSDNDRTNAEVVAAELNDEKDILETLIADLNNQLEVTNTNLSVVKTELTVALESCPTQ